MMYYVDKANKQFMVDMPVHKSNTTVKSKDGKEKIYTKYIAQIPKGILIFLLEHIKPFNVESDDAITYIDSMIKEGFYLSFYDPVGKDGFIELTASKDKYTADNCASVTVKKNKKADVYVFTVSKNIFNEINNNNDCDYNFRFVLDLDFKTYSFKNSIVNVKLV